MKRLKSCINRLLMSLICCLSLASASAEMSFTTITVADNASKPYLKMDPSGNGVLTWLESDGTHSNIKAKTFLKDGSWSEAQTIASLEGATSDHGVKLAVDPQGNAVIVWEEQMNHSHTIIKASMLPFKNSTWMEPVILSNPLTLSKGTEVIADFYGNVIAAWVDGLGKIQAASFIDGSWVLPSMNFSYSNNALNLKIAVSSNGDAVAVWEEIINQESFIMGARLAFKDKVWIPSTAPLSAPGASSPQIAMNKAGDAFAVWVSESHVIKTATLPSGTDAWSVPADNLSAEGIVGSQPQIVIDPAGNATVIWTGVSEEGSIIQSTVRSSARRWMGLAPSQWSMAINVSVIGENVSDPQIGVDASGNVVAVWRKTLSDDNIVVQSAKRTLRGSWSEATDLSHQGEKAGIPLISINHSGDKVVVVWTNEALGLQVGSLAPAVLAITSISPNCGPANGPNLVPVIIRGSGFQSPTLELVHFGIANATFTIDSDTQITVPIGGVPLHAAGTVDVMIEITTKPPQFSNDLPYTYVNAPAITSVTSAAFSGNTLTIIGTNFSGATAVTFGGTTPGTNLNVISDTEITVTVPTIPGAANCSQQSVTVTTCGGISNAFNFTYQIAAPTIISISFPNPATVGDTMTILGMNLSGATAVTFGGTPVTNIIVVSNTEIKVTVPTLSGATNCSQQSVTVTTCTGTSNAFNFTYGIAAPMITSISPDPTTVGQLMTILGMNLTSATAVTFGGTTPGTNLNLISDTEITVIVPTIPGATNCSIQNVTVTTCAGTSNALNFTYGIAAPSITSISPNPATVGDTMTILGMNLTSATAITFGGTTPGTNVTVVSDIQIIVTVPTIPGASNCSQQGVTVTTCLGTSNPFNFTYGIAAPMITSISPDPTTVGQLMTIIGTNFSGATAVTFGGTTPGTNLNLISDTEITVIVPTIPGATNCSTQNVTVTTCAGTSNALNFTYGIAAPSITSISPNPATVGDTMTILGMNLTSATAITFGGTTPGTNVTVVSDIQIIVTVPTIPGASNCSQQGVTVTTCLGTSNPFNFTYGIAAPMITSISPDPTTVGQSMTIIGANLSEATEVTFGGTTPGTNIIVVSDTEVTVTVPTIPGAPNCSTQSVAVTTCAGTSNALNFTYGIGSPSITSVTPNPAAVGQSMTIIGMHLTSATAVTFGGTTPGTNVSVVSDTEVTVTVPTIQGAPNCSQQSVTVTTCEGTSNTFNFTYGITAPTITSVNPNPATVGQLMTIIGTNLTSATTVTFGGTTPGTNIIVVSDTKITVTVPTIQEASNCSTQTVTVTTCEGISNSINFSYGIASPIITSVAPNPAAMGQLMTIIGMHLTSATAVTFGTTVITSFTIVNDGEIQIIVPTIQGAINCSTQSVTVTTCTGISNALNFTYGITVPTITNVSPNPATVGQSMTIMGTNLSEATEVTFGTTSVTSFTIVNDEEIQVIVPTIPGAINGSTQSVTVTTCAGISNTLNFTYGIVEPSVTSINPNTGPTSGGNSVTITGTGFIGVTAVQFGGVNALSFVINSSTSITAVVPAGINCESVDVAITGSTGGSSSTPADHYTYQSVPTISGVNPNTGPSSGGNSVNITGTDFNSVTAVQFGSANALSFVVKSATTITATAPAGAPGTADVTVITCGGTSPITVDDQYTYQNNVPQTPKSPSKFIGCIKENKFLNKRECILEASWHASHSPHVVAYNIYKGDKIISRIKAKSRLFYEEKLSKCSAKGYSITAVNKGGQESNPVKLKIVSL